jgi:hypothetical protein
LFESCDSLPPPLVPLFWAVLQSFWAVLQSDFGRVCVMRRVPGLLGLLRVPVVARLGSVDVRTAGVDRVVGCTRGLAVDEAFGSDGGAAGAGFAVVRVDTSLAGGCFRLGLDTTRVGAGTAGADAAGFAGSDAGGFAGAVRATAAGGSGTA